jgi:hypothetical protein
MTGFMTGFARCLRWRRGRACARLRYFRGEPVHRLVLQESIDAGFPVEGEEGVEVGRTIGAHRLAV